jgi:hypothetical protein
MPNIFGGGEGFRIDPDVQSNIEHDYWEEFTRVNSAFTHDPDIEIRKVKKPNKVLVAKINTEPNANASTTIKPDSKISNGTSSFYPSLPGTASADTLNSKETFNTPTTTHEFDSDQEYIECRSIAVQTEKFLYDEEPEVFS